ncbi:hypothetical protein Efla_002425 [Eimeria flavescens]
MLPTRAPHGVSFNQDYGVSDEDGLGKPSLQVSADAKPAAFLGPRLQGRKAFRNWASISTVLVIFAVVMISSCLRTSKRLVRGGLTRRRLAHGGEDEDNDDAMLDNILEECLDMEEAAGWASHHGAPIALDPMAATTEEVKPVPQAVSTGFSTGLGSPPSASAPQIMPGVYTPTYSSVVTDQLQPLDSVVSEGPARPSVITFASTAPLPSISPEDASDSLLLSQLSTGSWLEFIPNIRLEWPWLQGEATASGFQEMLEDYEQPSASAELMGETSTEAELSPSTQSAHTRLVAEDQMEAAGEDTTPSVQTEAKEDEPSSASTAAAAAQATDPSPSGAEVVRATGDVGGAAKATDASPSIPKELGNLSMHPFIRLPIVRPEAILRDFNPRWSRPMLGRDGQQMLLCRIRERLLKHELDAAEVQELMLETEKLLLGPRMAVSRWWGEFVNSLPRSYPPARARPQENTLTRARRKFVLRLLAAINIYKTGVRPDLKEVLKLKRMLLCSPNSILYFKEHQFDPWRRDDADFRQAHGEVSDDSTDEEDD